MAVEDSTQPTDLWGSDLWKKCGHCKQHLPLKEFAKLRTGLFGRQKRCRRCQAEMSAKCPTRTSEGCRRKHLKARYRMSVTAFHELLQSQGNACAVCGRSRRRYVVDHCHSSGKTRGILCYPCNNGLGLFRDSPALLRAAAEYLERHL